MVLLEARGLSLFLVIRGGIACISDSVPKHTGPNSVADTHLEPSVSRTRPTTTRENRRRWKGLFIRDAQASCRCNCVASKSTPFFQIVRVMLAIFRARVRRAIVRRRHDRTARVGAWLLTVVMGYYQYHAVPGNTTQLRIFQRRVNWLWRSVLIRRSQRAQVRWERHTHC
jgi:hypothetical protein